MIGEREIVFSTRNCPRSMRLAIATSRSRVSRGTMPDRKSTRLNSSHLVISYAVFCLKKKNTDNMHHTFKYSFTIIIPRIRTNSLASLLDLQYILYLSVTFLTRHTTTYMLTVVVTTL